MEVLCGDGSVDAALGEQCDDGPLNGATDCGADCRFRYASSCIAAEEAECTGPRAEVFGNTNPTLNTPPLSAAARSMVAADLLVCVRVTRCSTLPAPDDFFRCLCGSMSGTTCLSFEPGPASTPVDQVGTDFVNTKAGAANGPCIAEMIAAAGPRAVAFNPALPRSTSITANMSVFAGTRGFALNDVRNLDACTRSSAARAACHPGS